MHTQERRNPTYRSKENEKQKWGWELDAGNMQVELQRHSKDAVLASTEIECFSVETSDPPPPKALSSLLLCKAPKLVIGPVISATGSATSTKFCSFETQVDMLVCVSRSRMTASDATFVTSFTEHSANSQTYTLWAKLK